jgi:hypothetical protein
MRPSVNHAAALAAALAVVCVQAPAARADMPSAIIGLIGAKAQAQGHPQQVVSVTMNDGKSWLQKFVTDYGTSVGTGAAVGTVTALTFAGLTALGLVTIPAWGTVAIGLAVGTGTSLVVGALVDGAWEAVFGTTPAKVTVTLRDPTTGQKKELTGDAAAFAQALANGGAAYSTTGRSPYSNAQVSCLGSNQAAVGSCLASALRNDYQSYYGQTPGPFSYLTGQDGGNKVLLGPKGCASATLSGPCAGSLAKDFGVPTSTTSTQTCSGAIAFQGSCGAPAGDSSVSAAGTAPVTIEAGLAKLPDADKSKPLAPAMVAAAANGAWKGMSGSTDYRGAPYNAGDPITESDVNAWRAQNPASYPKGSDMLAPGSTASVAAAATSSDPLKPSGTATSGTGNTTVDLGPDPGVGPGTLASQTGSGLIASVLGAMPGIRAFVMPLRGAACPVIDTSISWAEQGYSAPVYVDGHCVLLESIRIPVGAGCMLAWTIFAVRRYLSA